LGVGKEIDNGEEGKGEAFHSCGRIEKDGFGVTKEAM